MSIKTLNLLLILLYINVTFSQNIEKDSIQVEIDSLIKKYNYKRSKEAFNVYQYLLKKSKEINYEKGLLQTYTNLVSYHGWEKNLDSVLHYSNLSSKIEMTEENRRLKLMSLNGEGQIFDFYFGLTERALESYIEYYKHYEAKNEKDKRELYTLKYALANSYLSKKQYDKTIEILNNCLKDSTYLHNSLKYRMLSLLGNVYQVKKMPEKSIPLNEKALNIAITDKVPLHYILAAKQSITYDYYLEKDYKKALDSLLAIKDKLASIVPQAESVNYDYLSIYYEGLGNTKKAIYYLNKTIETTPRYKKLPDLYKRLIEYYTKTNQKELILKTYKAKQKVIDSIRGMEQKAFINYYDNRLSLIDLEKAQKKSILEHKILENKNEKQQDYITKLLVFAGFLILVIILIVLYKKYDKSEEKVKQLEENKTELLKNHIKVRESELSALIIAHNNKRNKLGEIKETLSEAIKNNSKDAILKSEKKLFTFIKNFSVDDFFSKRIESQYPGIVHQLQSRHEELSSTDIKHCIFVKLGLSLKESAELLNVTTGTVKTARNRAKTKIKLPEGVSLKSYLDTIKMGDITL